MGPVGPVGPVGLLSQLGPRASPRFGSLHRVGIPHSAFRIPHSAFRIPHFAPLSNLAGCSARTSRIADSRSAQVSRPRRFFDLRSPLRSAGCGFCAAQPGGGCEAPAEDEVGTEPVYARNTAGFASRHARSAQVSRPRLAAKAAPAFRPAVKPCGLFRSRQPYLFCCWGRNGCPDTSRCTWHSARSGYSFFASPIHVADGKNISLRFRLTGCGCSTPERRCWMSLGQTGRPGPLLPISEVLGGAAAD